MSDLLIYDRRTNQANPHTIKGVFALSVSWVVNGIGLLSASCTVAQLRAAGLSPDILLGKWVKYVHPKAGYWNGYITSVAAADGNYTLACQSWIGMLQGAAIGPYSQQLTPGTRLMAAIQSAGIGFVSDWYTDFNGWHESDTVSTLIQNMNWETGDPYSLLTTLIRTIAEYTTYDPATRAWGFWLDDRPAYGINPRVIVRIPLGTDRSSQYVFRERTDAVTAEWGDDLSDIVNHFTATQTVPEKADTIITIVNTPSILQYGRRHKNISYNSTSLVSIEGTLRQANNLPNQQDISITVADINDDKWTVIREGDTVGVEFPTTGRKGILNIYQRALNVDEGTMTLAGTGLLGITDDIVVVDPPTSTTSPPQPPVSSTWATFINNAASNGSSGWSGLSVANYDHTVFMMGSTQSEARKMNMQGSGAVTIWHAGWPEPAAPPISGWKAVAISMRTLVGGVNYGGRIIRDLTATTSRAYSITTAVTSFDLPYTIGDAVVLSDLRTIATEDPNKEKIIETITAGSGAPGISLRSIFSLSAQTLVSVPSVPWGIAAKVLFAYVLGNVNYYTFKGCYVSFPSEHKVRAYDENFVQIAEIGGFGTAQGQFDTPRGICTDSSFRVHIVDAGNSRVQVYDRNLNELLGTYGVFSSTPGAGKFSASGMSYIRSWIGGKDMYIIDNGYGSSSGIMHWQTPT